ncbi:MAG TPA: hypothetical protein VHA11_03115, partial [Bryobacteraceae bacterium]|nr:hypothetical protein [Bryobacteraceae bacterium]
MRITRVAAKPAAPAHVRAPWRWAEAAGICGVSLVLALGLAQVYRSKAAALHDTAQRLSRNEILLLRRAATPAEIAPYLRQYPDDRQRRFIAGAISRAVREDAPGNVGALAALRITRADAAAGRVAETYAPRFERARTDRVRLFGFDEFARLKPAFTVRTPDDFRSAFRRWTVLFFAIFLLTHLAWSIIGFRGDPWILPAVLLISGTGLILMVSLRDPVRDLLVFADFAFGVVAACALLAAIAIASHFMEMRSRGLFRGGALLDSVNDYARTLAKRGDLAFLASLALSAALLVFGSGPGESGAKVRLGFFQPVEVIRFLLVLFLASYFAARWEFLRELKERRIRTAINLPRLDHALPVMMAVAIAIAFFFLQRDLGPA